MFYSVFGLGGFWFFAPLWVENVSCQDPDPSLLLSHSTCLGVPPLFRQYVILRVFRGVLTPVQIMQDVLAGFQDLSLGFFLIFQMAGEIPRLLLWKYAERQQRYSLPLV